MTEGCATMTTDAPVEVQSMTLEEAVARCGGSFDGWLGEKQAAAAADFARLGVPTRRDEEWRQINLRPLDEARFAAEGGVVDAEAASGLAIEGLDAFTLVFINGSFNADRSAVCDLPEGVIVTTLRERLNQHSGLIENQLGSLAPTAEDAFCALNTAMLDDGVVVFVPRGVVVETPIYVLSITSGPVINSPRLLVVAEESASVTVIEDHVSADDAAHLTNSVAEITVGDNADVRHYMLARENDNAFNISTLKVTQGRDTNFLSQSMLIGGAIVRNNVHPILAGEGGFSVLNGLYLPTGTQVIDNHMRVEHNAAHCESRQYYKGVVADKGSGLFSGRIVVAEGSQKTDAVQSNQNLLLSDTARAHTKPQLEIYADDVKCTHGATIGELDEQAVFYLRSRGMSEKAARGLLVYAFAGETLDRIEIEPVRALMDRLIQDRLPHVQAVEEIL